MMSIAALYTDSHMDPWIIRLTELLALPEYGLSTVFVVSFISATLLPLGSEPVVFGLVKLNPALFWPAVLVATAGNTLGGALDWWMGFGAHKVVDKYKHSSNQVAVLTTISQLDQVYVDVTQSSTDLLNLKSDLAQGRFERVGQGDARIRIKLEDGLVYPHPGRLQFSGVSVDPGTGAVTLRAVVPNPDGLLMPGMYVRAQLDTGVTPQALLVPQQAVTRDTTGQASVLVVDAASKVERRAVNLDAAVGNRWMVVAGLVAGERVIVDGLQRVRPGDLVTTEDVVIKLAANAAPAAASTHAR